MSFTLKRLFLSITIIGVIAGYGVFLHRLIVGVNVTGATAEAANKAFSSRLTIPTSASNVDYYMDPLWVAVNFSVTEADFLAWCQDNAWPVKDRDDHFSVDTGKGVGTFRNGRANVYHYSRRLIITRLVWLSLIVAAGAGIVIVVRRRRASRTT